MTTVCAVSMQNGSPGSQWKMGFELVGLAKSPSTTVAFSTGFSTVRVPQNWLPVQVDVMLLMTTVPSCWAMIMGSSSATTASELAACCCPSFCDVSTTGGSVATTSGAS